MGMFGLGRQAAEADPVRPGPTLSLTLDQIAFYHREGYLSLPALTMPDEIARIRAIYDELFQQKIGFADGNYFDFAGEEAAAEEDFPQLFMPSRYRPELRGTLLWANAQAIARQLLGPDAVFVFEHALRKPAGGPATPWHQDHAFHQPGTRHETISIWTPLQDVTRENGCMAFIPRSHSGPLLSHRSLDDNPKIHAIEALGVDPSSAVACPLPAGGATIHHRLTLHHAAPNLGNEPRRAYVLMFGVPTAKPLVTTPHPWMAEKQTARDRREWQSLSTSQKLKRRAKRALRHFGIYRA